MGCLMKVGDLEVVDKIRKGWMMSSKVDDVTRMVEVMWECGARQIDVVLAGSGGFTWLR